MNKEESCFCWHGAHIEDFARPLLFKPLKVWYSYHHFSDLTELGLVFSFIPFQTGSYLATHETRNFGGDITRKGTNPKLKFKKLRDIVKQIVYIGVIDLAGLILRVGLPLHCHFGSFCRKI